MPDKIPRVFVGKRPVVYYVDTILTALEMGGKALVKGRGKYVLKAIIACDSLRRLGRIEYEAIRIGTEVVDVGKKLPARMPYLEIEVTKPLKIPLIEKIRKR